MKRNVFGDESVKGPNQGYIGLGERLEKPSLLEKVVVLGMPNVREVSVKYES
jgi:hypothetical protein